MTSRGNQAAHLHVKFINILLDCCIKVILHRKHLPSSSLLQIRSLIRQGLLPGRPAVGLPLRCLKIKNLSQEPWGREGLKRSSWSKFDL